MKQTPLLRKTPMKRTAFKTEPKPAAGAKQKKCKVRTCRKPFMPEKPFVDWCSDDCAVVLAQERIAKQKAKQQRQERAADKVKRDGMKTYPQLIKETQREFNLCVRLRDQIAGYPCISSGRPLDWSGNAVDCGHYRSTGSAPHLRFNFDNAHAQSKHDNQYKSGNAVDYRIGLIKRIGLERVAALEADNMPRKWPHEELRNMKEEFQRMAKELKRKIEK